MAAPLKEDPLFTSINAHDTCMKTQQLLVFSDLFRLSHVYAFSILLHEIPVSRAFKSNDLILKMFFLMISIGVRGDSSRASLPMVGCYALRCLKTYKKVEKTFSAVLILLMQKNNKKKHSSSITTASTAASVLVSFAAIIHPHTQSTMAVHTVYRYIFTSALNSAHPPQVGR